jgi:hypothetical protein
MEANTESKAVASPCSAEGVLVKRRHALWVLVLIELALLGLILWHFPQAWAQRNEFANQRTQLAEKVVQAEIRQKITKNLIVSILQSAQTEPQAAFLARKYQLHPP